MRNLLSIALCLPLAACIIGEENGSGGGGGDDTGDGGGGGGGGGSVNDGSLTGVIAADTTWTGTVLIGIDRQTTTRIDAGVTITVAPGTIIKFKEGLGAGLDIRGTLKFQGTSASKVQLGPNVDGNTYSLIVGSTGKLDLTYAVMTRGSIQTNPGSTTTITDTLMSRAGGDLLIMNGGSVTMLHSQIGVPPGQTDTTHCNIHTSGDANTINITKSNINASPYGLMLYGGQNAIFRNNNWYDNEIDIHTQPGVSGDVTGSWFDGTAPVAGNGATLTGTNALSATKIADAGVRP
ncbi:MAG TPA: hypothetical protein VNO30_06315 [Kofleriaceae bacterium]|nr:hypothetical protein [Kofleriaceae bacterium]